MFNKDVILYFPETLSNIIHSGNYSIKVSGNCYLNFLSGNLNSHCILFTFRKVLYTTIFTFPEILFKIQRKYKSHTKKHCNAKEIPI